MATFHRPKCDPALARLHARLTDVFGRYFAEVARASVVAGAVGFGACSGEAEAPTPPYEVEPPKAAAWPDVALEEPAGVTLEGARPLACDALSPSDLGLDEALDAVEIGRGSDASLDWGRPCARANDVDACLGSIRAAAEGRARNESWIVVTAAEGARVIASREELVSWVGPIDSAPRARLAAWLDGYDGLCGEDSGYRVDGGRVRALALRFETSCYDVGERRVLAVARDGRIQVLERASWESPDDVPCDGRRPEGLRGAPVARDLGSYLTRMAYHEAASVEAFETLADQLQELGAPVLLRAACRAAAHDERRHAAAVATCAAARGARVPPLAEAPPSGGTPLAIAVANARDGCVREAFGAAIGAHQARVAGDPDVRALMASIAEDEARHAGLSFALAAWLDRRLDSAERAQVRAARGDAIRALERRLDRRPRRYAAALGLPSPSAARAIARRLARDLWTEGAPGPLSACAPS